MQPEDMLWWTDWVVAATLTLCILLITAGQQNKTLSAMQGIMTLVQLFLGWAVFPKLVNQFVYGSNGQLMPFWPRIAVANLFALSVLFGSVLTGVNVNVK
ncbi:hypothetical protein [Amycolatopsis sp. NPDC051061]|uniref:hypothetical protein n=1 Tax=Amycolatopsis sp. NPDC051061 TaxID=3155042 RepID=UPI0034386A16